jgi:hypothetical protein
MTITEAITANDQAREEAWPRVEIPAASLAAAFKAVLPHVASPSDMRPALELIRVRFRPIDNAWTFTATNSYTLAESTVNAGLELAEITRLTERFAVFEVLISTADAKRIMARAKTEKTARITLVCATDPHAVLDIVWEYGAALERVLNQGVHYEYPKTDHLFPTSEAEHGPVTFSFSGDYLALFKPSVLARTSGEKSLGVTFCFSDSEGRKPLLVTFSDHFRGLIMPRRVPS